MIDTPSSCPFQNQRHASRKKTIFTYESTIFRHLIHDANLFMEISTHHKVQQMIYPTERTVRWPSKHQHHCRLCMLSTFAGNFIALEHKLTTIPKTILLAKKNKNLQAHHHCMRNIPSSDPIQALQPCICPCWWVPSSTPENSALSKNNFILWIGKQVLSGKGWSLIVSHGQYFEFAPNTELRGQNLKIYPRTVVHQTWCSKSENCGPPHLSEKMLEHKPKRLTTVVKYNFQAIKWYPPENTNLSDGSTPSCIRVWEFTCPSYDCTAPLWISRWS